MKPNAQNLTRMALSVALMTVCSWISIPLPVPVTLQTLGVFLSVGLLGGRSGTLAVGAYILLGALGMPVFAGFRGGPGVLLGSTGGYITGFLLAALTVWAVTRRFGNGSAALGVGMAAGQLVLYAVGTAWFMAVYTRTSGPVSLSAVLGWCVVPFILPDAAKLSLALLLTRRLRGRLR